MANTQYVWMYVCVRACMLCACDDFAKPFIVKVHNCMIWYCHKVLCTQGGLCPESSHFGCFAATRTLLLFLLQVWWVLPLKRAISVALPCCGWCRLAFWKGCSCLDFCRLMYVFCNHKEIWNSCCKFLHSVLYKWQPRTVNAGFIMSSVKSKSTSCSPPGG